MLVILVASSPETVGLVFSYFVEIVYHMSQRVICNKVGLTDRAKSGLSEKVSHAQLAIAVSSNVYHLLYSTDHLHRI